MEEAVNISKELVKNKLIACCNIIPGVVSVYEWEGEIQQENEFLMVIKTRKELFEDIKKHIQKLHSYEVPEIIEIPVTNGSESYISWLDKSTRSM